MLRILAPTDFSIDSYNATLVAVQVAQRFAGEVVFVHAMAKPPVPATSPEALFLSLYQEEERRKQQRLHDECNHLIDILNLRRGEVSYRTLVVPTPFAEAMLQVIARENIDLIVMGSKGSSEFKQIFVGSNTIELMRISPVPLLVIPSHSVFNGFSTITLLLEQKKHAFRSALDFLVQLARAYASSLQFLILTKDGKTVTDITELCADPAQWQELLSLPHQTSAIAYTAIPTDLEEYIAQTGTSLLVLMPDRRNVWEEFFSKNIAEELAGQARIPLLVLPPKT